MLVHDVERLVLNRARSIVRAASHVAAFVWARERLVLVAIVAAGLFFARNTWKSGIWADNDSVCHYAYLRHLVEDVYPTTGSFLGYSPKFNMGVPFLLYNTPPGLYVLAGLLSVGLPVSTLTALKICVVSGFISVPLLGFAIAKTFDDAPPDAPKFVALFLALFSSELYGLEFFFRNGMLNPAVGVPFLLASLYFFRRAQTAPFPAALRHIALGAFFCAATTCTHLLSTYMLCLALGAFLLARPAGRWGHDVLRLGVMLGMAGGLAAFWLVPSAPFAAAEDAAYTWLRRPQDTISSFFDGSLLSSYFAGFFPSFFTLSNVGFVAVAFGMLAIVFGLRRNAESPRAALLVFVTGAVITLGPTWSAVVRLLPGYDRLLWYRFLTLAEIGWLILAGLGAAYVTHLKPQVFPYRRLLLIVGLGWALSVMNERATKIETAHDYPEFVANVDEIAAWLKNNGDRRGRVFNEFLAEAVIQPPSVNYIRHMMPILSGFDEIGGWIYENNLAGQVLMKKGVFWYSPFPLIDQAPRYNVKYIVAGSPHFVRSLSSDPRWKSVLSTNSLVLFENVSYEPSIAEGGGLVGSLTSGRYLRGGGYEYEIDLAPSTASGPLVVKVGYLPHFTVRVDGELVDHRPSADGLLEIDLPEGKTPRTLRCTFDIGALRSRGNRLSMAAALLALAFIGLSFTKWTAPAALGRPLTWLGLGGAVLAAAGVLVRRGPPDLDEVGFGVRNGIVSYRSPDTVAVGAFDDAASNALVHLLPSAWGQRTTVGRVPARTLLRQDSAALVLALPRRGSSTVIVRGTPDDAAISLRLEAPNGEAACEVDGVMNAPISLPAECAGESGARSDALPGVTRRVYLASEDRLVVTSVTAETGIVLVEAEGLRNVVHDGGFEAFYSFSAIEASPLNSLVMVAAPHTNKPVDLARRVALPPGRIEAWVLMRTLHSRFRMTRAKISVWLEGEEVGAFHGDARGPRDYWERDTIFEWVRIGEATVGSESETEVTLRMERLKGAIAGLAEVDAVAFVPK